MQIPSQLEVSNLTSAFSPIEMEESVVGDKVLNEGLDLTSNSCNPLNLARIISDLDDLESIELPPCHTSIAEDGEEALNVAFLQDSFTISGSNFC